MAQTARNSVYSKPKVGGAVWSAPAGSTLPTDASAELDKAFKAWGFISDAGVKENNSPTSTNKKAYGGTTVLVIEGGNELTYTFTPIEYLNPHVQEEIYGSSHVTKAGEKLGGVEVTDDTHGHRVFVFEHVLSDGTIERDVLPDAVVSGFAANTYSESDALGPEVTVTPFPDSRGVKVYKYFAAAA